MQRSADRFVTTTDDVTTRHSFSYGAHYDPDNIAFGPIIAINEEQVSPGAGYDAHHHADVEIVSWVLEGALSHEDTTGHRGIIEPGTAQRLSAGTGVQHAERNASRTEPLRFVQMMLASEHVDEPDYASVDVDPEPGVLTPTVPCTPPPSSSCSTSTPVRVSRSPPHLAAWCTSRGARSSSPETRWRRATRPEPVPRPRTI